MALADVPCAADFARREGVLKITVSSGQLVYNDKSKKDPIIRQNRTRFNADLRRRRPQLYVRFYPHEVLTFELGQPNDSSIFRISG